jgi:hypothetical protein
MFNGVIRFSLIAIAFGSASFAQTVTDPMTAGERVRWLTNQNFGTGQLLSDLASGAETTLSNAPKEYGPHWEGFGKRVGITAADYGVDTAMEAALGSIWGEDPRYVRTEGQTLGNRVGHVVKMTFFARDRAGNTVPAYARLLAIPGGSFLANTWMPDSESTVGEAASRAGLSFLSRMGADAYKEFRPRK